MRNSILLCVSVLCATSLAQADLVPFLCQEVGSACGATPAFSQLGMNSYVYNYSIDLSSVEQINTTLGPSAVVLSGLTGVTGALAPTGWTVASTTATSVTFNATAAVNGVGPANFGIFAVDTSVGGGISTNGSYSSTAFKTNGLADNASGGLEVNAVGVPEPSAALLLGVALAAAGLRFGRSRSVRA